MTEPTDAPRDRDVEARVRRWIEEAVIGLDFCPFAASVYHTGRVRIAVSPADSPPDAVDAALDEVVELLETPPEQVATTLIAYPAGLDDFRSFLDVAETVRGALSEADAEGVLQVATFHPDYQFAGTAPDDLENYTNRSPVPIVHLLREDDVTEAVDNHPDPEGIPERNIERLREMGREEIEHIWEQFDGESR